LQADPPISIRRVTPDDAEALVGILNPIIREGRFTVLDQEFTTTQEREFIERFPARGVFLAAEIDGAVVGFQNIDLFAAYTRAFDHVGVIGTYVDEAFRGRGVARALFAASFAAAREAGFEKIFTFVRADNPVALRAYQAQGFRVIGEARRQAKIRGRYVDEILIEKIFADDWL
jgi:L-amino acid N-acyltransferase YncA